MAAAAEPTAHNFLEIFRKEIEAINRRRAALKPPDPRRLDPDSAEGHQVVDVVGVALSGGGVRSAAFSLGVLQGFNHHHVLRNVDYLSTVSGGGYIGSSLSATMTKTEGEFVFGSAPAQGPSGEQAASELSDTPEVGHLRNYSNYLIPRGFWDFLIDLAIVVRGLVANFAAVISVILIAAAVTVLFNPYRSSLKCADDTDWKFCSILSIDHFGVTLLVAVLGLPAFFIWALYRSLLAPRMLAEFRTQLPKQGARYLVGVAAVLFIELQPFVIHGIFDLGDKGEGGGQDRYATLTGTITWLATVATSIAAAVTFFRQQLGSILKASNTTAKPSTKALAFVSKGAFWIAGAALPLLVWVGYIYLAYWGIINDATVVSGAHTPRWLINSATFVSEWVYRPLFERVMSGYAPTVWLFERTLDRPVLLLYAWTGFAFLILSWWLKPNANSLHRLYRDRLSKAFLFDPRPPEQASSFKPDALKRGESRPSGPKRNEASRDQRRDFPELDDLRLSSISNPHGPYHLINAALNIQGSDFANRRGRNADFFLFSPLSVGSEATGYAPTKFFEDDKNDLDLATAMAISGAAASSNMGSKSIRPLTPTLALLNIRLGYWLKNPRYAVGPDAPEEKSGFSRFWPRMFLWSEITGRLYENSDDVYLSDGGHIENLGVYQLLKRRCKVIVAVDAEADFALHFPSFITLQRYARIDLGVRIDMPWENIQDTTCTWMGLHTGDEPASRPKPSRGPHAAIGRIDYGGGEYGILLYIKSSLTGDENDYVRDYARRYVHFPHETTSDQFFTEEQFEVYRALGFHATHGIFCGRDTIQTIEGDDGLTIEGNHKLVTELRAALQRGRPTGATDQPGLSGMSSGAD